MKSVNLNVREHITDIIKSLGIVFGDIGTSPIYTFSAIFSVIPTSIENVMGVSSLIIWTLVIMVTGQYTWLAMSLGKEHNGEGGIIILKEILIDLLSSKTTIAVVSLLCFIGTAFFIGDGIITPAISILSAVEGLKFIPNLQALNQQTVILVAIVITITLFAFQRRGTEKISVAFGPIMCIWFAFLAFSGIDAISRFPHIMWAISPYYAWSFIWNHGFIALILLSKILLCATGCEPLFADMGHLGERPIRHAWHFVFPCLCLIYLGQAAFLINNPGTKNIFYIMALKQFNGLYIPILILSIIATVIASQAMISGLFSIIYQAITTRMLPHFHVEYTSRKLMTQIFIPAVNIFLLCFVLLTIIIFKTSENLTDAYGIAVSGTMTITAIMLTCIFFLKKNLIKSIASFILIFINMLFLTSNLFKIPTGGYWSLLVACIPLTLILIYTLGQRKLNQSLKQIPLNEFAENFEHVSQKVPHINGTALFLSKKIDPIPAYIATTMFSNTIMYEENIIVKIKREKTAFGISSAFAKDLAPGLRFFVIKAGYLEVVNIVKILNTADIHPKVIFYGLEEFSSKNLFWKIYIIIKRVTPSFVQFYKFPVNKLHGVAVQVKL